MTNRTRCIVEVALVVALFLATITALYVNRQLNQARQEIGDFKVSLLLTQIALRAEREENMLNQLEKIYTINRQLAMYSVKVDRFMRAAINRKEIR